MAVVDMPLRPVCLHHFERQQFCTRENKEGERESEKEDRDKISKIEREGAVLVDNRSSCTRCGST